MCVNCQDIRCSGCDRRSSLYRLGVKPLKRAIADEVREEAFFDNSIYIPYATSSQGKALGKLKYLHTLARMSPTKEACVNFIKNTAFGEVEIVRRRNVFGIMSEEEVGEEEKNRFIQLLADHLHIPCTLQTLARNLCHTYLVDGNMALIEKIIKVDEVQVGYIDFAHTLDYTFLRKSKAKRVAYSKYFHQLHSEAELKKRIEEGKVMVLPVNGAYQEYKKLKARLHHAKEGTNDYWGRPSTEGCIEGQSGEYYLRNYQVTQAKYGFTVRSIIEKEGFTPKQISSLNELINTQWINKNGETTWQNVLVLERAMGAAPLDIKTLAPFTEDKFFKGATTRFREDIIMCHNLSERLLGRSTANGFSDHVFFQEFAVKSPTVIEPNQMVVHELLNGSIKNVLEELGHDTGGLYIKFKNKYQDLLNERHEFNRSTRQQLA